MTTVQTQFFDDKTQKSITLEYEHTKHSLKRAKQRALTNNQISFALGNGKEVCKQGLIFYIVGNQVNSNNNLNKQDIKKIKNLVVVVAEDSNTIITCYRNNSPFKHINKKPKKLFA